MSQFAFSSQIVVGARGLARKLRGRHLAGLSAVAAAAFGLAGLRALDLPGPRPVVDGERLRIEVVHPVEPEIVPGQRMDVGELVDGFAGLPPPAPAPMDVLYVYDEDREGDRPLPPLPASTRRPVERIVAAAPPEPEPARPRQPQSRWFGFDAPRRDYQAERAARRARLEALDRQAWERREARREDWARRDREWRRETWRSRDAEEQDRPDESVDRPAFTGPQ
jgi:hypothetical protein